MADSLTNCEVIESGSGFFKISNWADSVIGLKTLSYLQIENPEAAIDISLAAALYF